MRKNISTDPLVKADLGENDEIVKKVTTETVVGRRRRPEPEPIPLEPSFEIEPDEIVLDADEYTDDDEDEDVFAEGSVGAILNQTNDDRLRTTECTIRVMRKADSPGEKFARPCLVKRYEVSIPNVELTRPQSEIEDIVRSRYGGGSYYLQIQIGSKCQSGWNVTLGDDPENAAGERGNLPAAATQPAAQSPPPVAVDPFKQMVEQIAMMKQLRDGLFGEEQKRMEDKISELQAKLESREETTTAPQSDLALAVSLLKANNVNDPGIVDFIKDQLNPSEKEPSMTIWDFMKYLGDNADKIVPVAIPLLTSLFPGLAGGPSPQMPPPGMPQQIPPPAFPPPPPMQSMFAPRTPEPFEQPPAFEPMPAFDAMPLPEPPATEPKPEIDPVFEPDTTAIIQADEPKPGVDIRHDDEPATPPKRIRHAKFKKDEENETDAAAKP